MELVLWPQMKRDSVGGEGRQLWVVGRNRDVSLPTGNEGSERTPCGKEADALPSSFLSLLSFPFSLSLSFSLFFLFCHYFYRDVTDEVKLKLINNSESLEIKMGSL